MSGRGHSTAVAVKRVAALQKQHLLPQRNGLISCSSRRDLSSGCYATHRSRKQCLPTPGASTAYLDFHRTSSHRQYSSQTTPASFLSIRERKLHLVRRSYSSTTPPPTAAASASTSPSQDESSPNTTFNPNDSQTQQDQQQRDKPSRARRFLIASSLFAIFLTGGFAMSAAPAAETINGWMNPPSDAETLKLVDPSTPEARAINDRILSHPLAQALRQNSAMVESRPHMKIPPGMRAHNLTAGTLMAPGRLEVPPLIFTELKAELPTMVQISYFGPGLCGHPGIVHGGLLATILDEGLARCCFPALPNKVGVTASLKIDYRAPCPADRLVVLKAYTTKVEGRKAWVKGWLELLDDETGEGDGKKLVEAEALFVEPRHAKSMARVYSSQ